MEFWGVEVESGQPFEVIVGEGEVLHLSQATLGEIKKKTKEYVVLHITQNEKKLVLGTLNSERRPQQLFDVVFDKDFQISHNYKNGSVFFYGYKEENLVNDYEDSEDEEEELTVTVPNDAMSEDSDDDEDNAGSSDDEKDSDEEEETPTPKKQSGKKRPNEPASMKKAKKGKKGGAVHIATPHPSKQAVAKTPAGGSKSNQKSPASADGAYSCKACNRKF